MFPFAKCPLGQSSDVRFPRASNPQDR
jgi:hypothetical protein